MIRLLSVGSRGDHLSPGWGCIVLRTALPGSVYVLEECPPQLATTLRHGLSSTDVACFADQPA
jgi:hypothetical protein